MIEDDDIVELFKSCDDENDDSTKKRYTKKEKQDAYDLFLQVRNLKKVSQETGIKFETLKSWSVKYGWKDKAEFRDTLRVAELTEKVKDVKNALLDGTDRNIDFQECKVLVNNDKICIENDKKDIIQLKDNDIDFLLSQWYPLQEAHKIFKMEKEIEFYSQFDDYKPKNFRDLMLWRDYLLRKEEFMFKRVDKFKENELSKNQSNINDIIVDWDSK